MGDRATIRMKSGDVESKEYIYLHWGGGKVGNFLMEAEKNAIPGDLDACLTALENAAVSNGYTPERGVIEEGMYIGSDAGDFIVDVSQPHWQVEHEKGTGYGLQGESKYHFGHAPFEVPADVNGRPERIGRKRNYSYLYTAVSEGDYRMAEALLEAGADPNQQEFLVDKRVPLHQAAYNDDMPMAQLLIKHAARLDIKDSTNTTPIEAAERMSKLYNKKSAVLQYFEEHQAFLKADKVRGHLIDVAQRNRPQAVRPDNPDVATPEEALAAKMKNCGFAM